jgi:hypothetical protein
VAAVASGLFAAMGGGPAMAIDDDDPEAREAAALEERVAELEATTARKGNFRLSVGAGESRVTLPAQILIGTKFVPFHGGGDNGLLRFTEAAIAETQKTLDGENFNASAAVPTGFLLPGTEIQIDFSNTNFDGASSGRVPEGGRDVALPYLDELRLPDGRISTGIFGGNIGTKAAVRSDGEIVDVTGGLTFPLGVVRGLVGARYTNFEWNNDVDLTTPTFSDLTQRTWMKQESDFFGAVFGAKFERLPLDQGLTYGADLRVALGQLDTSATALQITHAGPLGKDNPEFRVRLARGFSANDFSTIFGGSAHVGWRFWRSLELRLEGSVEQMTNVPYFKYPYSPDLQPISLGFGDLTEATIGGRLIWRPGGLHFHRSAVAANY